MVNIELDKSYEARKALYEIRIDKEYSRACPKCFSFGRVINSWKRGQYKCCSCNIIFNVKDFGDI
jgi:transposase-like protein